MLLNPFRNAFGLDIGDRSIKIAQLFRRRSGWKKWSYKLNHFSEMAVPEGIIADGELLKPEHLVRLFKAHLEENKDGLSLSPWVVACLPETKTYIQLIKIKNQEKELSEAAIKEVAPSYLPYDLKDIYLDWQVLPDDPSDKEKKSVILSAVPKRIADSYTYFLNICGLTPLALEIEAAAITRAVINRRKDLSQEARGILDLGATRSGFVIYDHGVIQFSLSLPFAGQEVTEKIRQALNIEAAEAEKIKKECGVDDKLCRGQLKEVLQQSLDDLADKLARAIQFYKIHFPDKRPLTGIRISGGGAYLPALENYLSAKLKLKIRKANPWVNLFSPKNQPMPAERSLFFTTAIGLAIKAAESPLSFK